MSDPLGRSLARLIPQTLAALVLALVLPALGEAQTPTVVTDETTFRAAISSAVAGDIIQFGGDITLATGATPPNVPTGVKVNGAGFLLLGDSGYSGRYIADESGLRTALTAAAPGDTIVFTTDITLTQDLPNVGTSITIDGAQHSLSGLSGGVPSFRGLFVAAFVPGPEGSPPSPAALDVTIQDLNINDTLAKGGSGGDGAAGGGGGAGMGGALFIGERASVTVSNVNLNSNAATGGAGGVGSTGLTVGGGGGGLGGNGGAGDTTSGAGGGGGGIGAGATGGGAGGQAAGSGILTGISSPQPVGGGGGTAATNSGSWLPASPGGILNLSSGSPLFGGGGAGVTPAAPIGLNSGGFGGGGGGTNNYLLYGAGGYGGGGGGSTDPTAFNSGGTLAGAGGYVAGGGAGGGGGAGLGGAVFVQEGGRLNVVGDFTVDGGTVEGGAAGAGGTTSANNGSSAGSGVFFQGNVFSALTFAPGPLQNATVSTDIVDEFGLGVGEASSASVTMNGFGRLFLAGNNLYSGGTDLKSGTLSVSSDANLGLTGLFAASLNGAGDTTLEITGSGTFAREFTLGYWGPGTQNISVASGQTPLWSGVLSAGEGASPLGIIGGGTLTLTNTSNTQATTTVSGDSKLIVGDDRGLGVDPFTGSPTGDVTLGAPSSPPDVAASGGTLGIDPTLAPEPTNVFFSSRAFSLLGNGGRIDTIGSPTNATLNGEISGDGSLTKTGAGLLTIGNIEVPNTYTGPTIVNAGTLMAAGSAAFGTSNSLSVAAGATLDLSTFDHAFDSVSGSGTIALTGTSSPSILRPVLTVGGGGGSSAFDGVISGLGSLLKTGTGLFELTSGANTYSGGTTVSGGGTLLVGANADLGDASGGLTLGGASSGGTLGINSTSFLSARAITLEAGGGTIDTIGSSSAATVSGVIGGTGSLTKTGSGALTLSGANTFSGDLSLTGGSLNVSADANLGASGGAVRMSDGTTLGLTSSGTFSRALQIAGTSTLNIGGGQSVNWDGLVSNDVSAGILRLTGGGTLALGNTSNSYSGGTIVDNNSTLRVSDDGALGASGGGITLGDSSNGGTLDLAATSFLSARAITLQAGGGTINTGSTFAAELGGAIGGSTGALTKTGLGTLTLSGTNTFAGGLFLNEGTLNVAADANLGGAGDVRMSGGTTLGLTSSSTFAHGLQITGTSTVNVGGGVSATWTGQVTDFASAGMLRLTGGGLFALTNTSNSHSGGTTVAGGSTLSISSNAALGATPGGLTLGDEASSGTLALTTNGAFASSRAITLGLAGATIDTSATTTALLDGVISGGGSLAGLTKSGSGVLSLAGTNTFMGGVSVTGGTLNISSDANLGASGSSVRLGDSTTLGLTGSNSFASNLFVANSSTVNVGGSVSATWGGVVADTVSNGILRLTGGGTLALSNASNSYSGGTVVTGNSTLNVTEDANLSASGGTVTLDSGTLGLTGSSFLTSRGITLQSGGGTFNAPSPTNATFDSLIGGSGSLRLTGGGLFTLTNASNAYLGGTAVDGNSTLRVSTDGALGETPGGLTLGGGASSAGTLDIAATNFLSARAITLQDGGGIINTGGTSDAATLSGVIGGTGGLTKSGNGVLTLSGANTYTGGTTVSGGSLWGTSTSLVGNIANSAAVGFNQAFDGSFAGVMSGAGSLTKSGTGALTLSGANTYTGGTTVSAGSLWGTSTSLTGAITNNALVGFNQAVDGTFAGVMSGTGSLTKSGSGALTLSGANTYSGGTTVSAGSLWGTSTSLTGNITNNALVGFNQAFDGTFAGVMSGTGSLTKLGTGALTLSGANTYTGGTTVSAGSLWGTSTSLTGAITNNALVGFNQAFDGTFAGVMSGTGSLTKIGTGALTLSGANTYIGGTTVSGGSLWGTSTSLTGNITNDALVGFNQAVDGTFAGVMSGTGSLTKTGTGALTLSGANTYTGGTTVSGGSLWGTSTSLVGNITNNALVGFNQAFDGTFAGVMTGTGSLTKTGTGALTLAGANTYTGGTTVSGGSLWGTSSSLVGNITNNALVGFNQAFDGTFAGVMSGTGSLTKSGTGALTLSGTNTYTGGTTVSGGLLWGTSTSLTGNVTNDALVGFNQAFDGTFAGVMSGTGSLTKTGTGALTLSGANTYTGGTTVSGGSLWGSSTSLTGNITNDALVGFNQAFDGTFAGVMSGTGSLTKIGTGALTLSGTNTYTGGTTVSAGSLWGTSTSLTGYITNDALVGFNQAVDGTFAGLMSGTGSLTKTGTGALTLSGANTYTGGTTVSAGSLWGTSSSLVGNITNDALVGFNQAFDGSYVGVMSGTGSLTKTGSGALTLSGANTYTGGTTVSGGSLWGTSTSLTGDIANNALVGFNQAFDGTFAGVMTGTGSLTKSGTGALTLSGTNTYSGGTTVSAGSLWGTSTSLTGNITNDALVGFNQALDGTFAGVMSGTGSLTKLGTGALTLSGANTYTGGTTVSGGSLWGTSTSLTGNITNDALVGFNQAFDGAFAGVMSGTGSLTKTGSGALTLSGNTTYTGGTTVSAGSLWGTSTSLTGNIANDALVGFNQAFDGSYVGAMGGTGSLTKSGTGALTLSGTNTYTGGTTVSGGSLWGTSSSLVGNITNNALVGFNQAFDGTFAGVMSGTGSLTKSGTGALTLSGANTYTGGTTVSGGSLWGTSTSLVGNIANDALVGFNQAFDGTFAGVMSGTGSLTKTGTGALTLAGANTYTGGTTVSGGSLWGKSTSLVGNITNDALVGFNQAFDGSYVGAMGGTGSLTKSGTGALTLSGTNTYTGGTTVSGGSLWGTSTSLVGNITNNALVGFNQAFDGSYVGVMSGTGSLTKIGTGALTLSGANTYTGGTTVSGGSLWGTSTSLTGAITNNALVGFNQAFDGTFAGVMSGTGSLTKLGTGALTLSGTNTYTGGTTVSAGSLWGTSTSLTCNITNDALVGFNQAFDGSYVGVMSGTGSLTKIGTGALTLSGANTYTGGSTVSAGSLWGTSTSVIGDITNDALVGFNQAFDGTFAGAMSGTGSLTKTGTGALTLSGANTYTGGTTVSGGSLWGTSTSLTGAITNNALVGFNQAFDGSYVGVMSGTGSLTKLGTGALTLSGTNTYTGGTTVSAGSLWGTSTSLTGNITNDALVGFNQAFDGSYVGVMSGTGSLTKIGTGALTLSGATTYTGGTTVSGGSLWGTSTSLVGNIANSAAVGFNQAFDGTFAGVMSGTGSLTKIGTGALTLSGANTYTGGTTVSGGSLWGTSTSVIGDIANDALVGFNQAFDGTFAGVMSGTGSLTKTGTGALTLAGANTYTGGTTVSGGSLWGTSTSVIGDITNDALVGFNQAFDGTFAGVMSGTGSLTKLGTGALTLSGANTYTGGTTVSGGSLWGTSTSLTGAITNNALVGFNQAFDGTFAGVMSGTGSLTKLGTGALTLSGTNTYTGGTTVSAGSLWGTSTSLIGNITNNAAVGFNQAFDGTFAGVMSGTGSLTKLGTGALTLSGANTYTGGTTVSAGSLWGSSTSLTGNITNNALVGFNQAFDGSYVGVMSGTGSLTKSGSGALTLAGANTYTGGTTVSGGSLWGTSTSLTGNIANSALVGFNQAFDGTFAGVMSGTGSLTKIGTGALTLSGANTYAGGTTVSAGSLWGTSTSLVGNITNDALVGFNQALDGTFAGVMSGTGSLTKLGTGALTLSGANTYTGGTTVSGGSLWGTSTSLVGNITNDALVGFNQALDGTFAGVMSGTGSLTKTGTGALTLSGANTYTGGTTVSAGSLWGTSTSLIGNITNNAAVGFNQAFDGSYVGVMSGTGSLTKSGSGALTLAGANTYTGGTTVSAGSLWGTSTSLIGNITNNALVGFNQALDGSYVGVMSGTGSLTKTGSGALTLSGANTYSGGTTVSAGSLWGTSTSLTGNITNNALVGFNQAFDGTFAGVMSGTGSLTKLGTGALTLSGANTYTGGTTVSAGSLWGTSTSLVGNIANSAAAGFNQAFDGSYVGVMSGTGSLTKIGTGALTLSGANTYTGGTTVSAGSLWGTSTSLTGAITNNALVGFNQAVDGTFAGAMSGTGSLTKSGTGALTLSGTNTYTGGTTVSAGSLWGTSTSLTGAITNNALVGFNQAFDGTFAGVMSGTGSLTKTGTGALTLAGANTYTGGTTVSGGSLWGTSTSVIGDIMNDALVGFNQAFDGTFAGAMSGSGSLTKTGTGALTLSGANTYTGGTTVNGGGTLNVSADDNLGSIGGGLTMGNASTSGTLAINVPNFLSDRAITLEAGGGSINTIGATMVTMGGAISGSGDLTKSGSGSLTLAGTNTFSGGLSLAGGTLNVSADANLGGSTSAVRLSNATVLGLTGSSSFAHDLFVATTSTVNVNSGVSATWSGVVGDSTNAGVLRLTGGGTLTLTNATNSYSGGTIVTGGSTLVVASDGSLGDASSSSDAAFVKPVVPAKSPAVPKDALGAPGTGIILGDGESTGTLSLTPTGNFLSSRAITIGALGATINTADTTVATLSGEIGGTGGVTKSGVGTLTLSGTNTFSGGLSLAGGTLNVSSDANLGGAGAVSMSDATTLGLTSSGTFAHALQLAGAASLDVGAGKSVAWNGLISGNGALVKSGAGSLTLAGPTTYAGGTFVLGGSLAGDTTNLRGLFLNNGEVLFNQATDDTFQGYITGTGGLSKLGTGTVSLANPQGYTGLTWVKQGGLAFNSGLAGSVRVDPGATLWAAGAIGGSVDVAGSLLVGPPGMVFSTRNPAFGGLTGNDATAAESLFINGDLNATPGSTIGLSVTPNAPPPLIVSGVANLVDTHFNMIIDDPNPTRISSYLAISAAGGLHFTGGEVTSPSASLVPVVRSDSNSMVVTLLNYGVPLNESVTSPNAVGVGRALSNGSQQPTGDYGFVVRELRALSDESLDSALRQISGEIHASAARMISVDGVSITEMVRNEVSEAEQQASNEARPSTGPLSTLRPWFSLGGNHTNFTSGEYSGGTANVGGGGGGLDFRPGSNWTAGAGLALSVGDLSLSDLSETSKLIAPRAFTYYGFGFGPFHVHWGGSVARSKTTTKRTITFAAVVPNADGQPSPLSEGVDRTAASSQVTVAKDAWSDWQYTKKFGTWTFDGKLGLRFASCTRKGFSESGADSISLDVADQTLSTREFSVDIHHFRHAGTWRPNFWVTYTREFSDDWTKAAANFEGDPDSVFEVKGMPIPRDTIQGLLGITMRSGVGLLYSLEFQFLRNAEQKTQSLRFKVRF